MERLHQYAEDKRIVNVTDFPIWLKLKTDDAPAGRAALTEWLQAEGFSKGFGAAFARNGKQISQQYCFGDTFEIYVSWSSIDGEWGLDGYGISTADRPAEPALKRLIQFFEQNYKVKHRETKGL